MILLYNFYMEEPVDVIEIFRRLSLLEDKNNFIKLNKNHEVVIEHYSNNFFGKVFRFISYHIWKPKERRFDHISQAVDQLYNKIKIEELSIQELITLKNAFSIINNRWEKVKNTEIVQKFQKVEKEIENFISRISPEKKLPNEVIDHPVNPTNKIEFQKEESAILNVEANLKQKSTLEVVEKRKIELSTIGTLTREEAEFLLKNKEPGSWLIRFSSKQDQFVLSFVNNKNKIHHELSIKSDKKIDFIEDFEKKLNLKFNECLRVIYISNFSGYQIKFDDLSFFQKFKIAWPIDELPKCQFDEKNLSCIVNYNSFEILKFLDVYAELFSFFGSNKDKDCFNKHTPDGLSIERVNVKGEEEVDNKAVQQLKQKAKEFFSHISFFENALNLDLKDSFDKMNLIRLIFKEKKFPGLIIGECHSDLCSKKFLIEYMKEMKEQSVKTIFFEHLFYDTMQEDLDNYFKNADLKMPKRLEIYLDGLDKGNGINHLKWNFKEIIKAAKEAGIRIVAIDTEASYMCGNSFRDGASGPDRMYGLNYQALQIIQKEKGKDKYIVFVGSAHVSKSYGVPGLSEILNLPNLVISDAKESRVTFDQHNFAKNQGFEGIVHIHLEEPTPL
jgi:hypothetical protein